MAEQKRPGIDPANDETALFYECVSRYLENNLGAKGVAYLRQALSADPVKRGEFAMICLGEVLTREGAAREPADNPHFDAAADEPVPQAPARPRRQFTRPWRIAASVGVAITIGAALWFWSRYAPVAHLQAASHATWASGHELAVGSDISRGGEVNLLAGFAAIKLRGGTDLICEAPVRLSIQSGDSITLVAGKVSLRMPSGRAGFIVQVPSGTITDLGTEFGVIVDPVSGSAQSANTRVDVFGGRVSITAGSTSTTVVKAGDAARLAGGEVKVEAGAAQPQRYVRNLLVVDSLDVVDLLNGGDGTTNLRGGQIDPLTGNAGNLPAGDGRNADREYHPVPSLPVVDGSFTPNGAWGPAKIDSAGHAVSFPVTDGQVYLNIVAGAPIPVPAGADPIGTSLAGIDYAIPPNRLLLMHPNCGLTLDLAAVRRLHPGLRLTSFHCTVGNSHPHASKTLADAYVFIDGTSRFERRKFTAADGAFDVDLPITDSMRFLTLVTTDGGDKHFFDDVLFGDPAFSAASGE